MARINFLLTMAVIAMLFLCPVASADIPHMINYQGKLTTASGGCLNDTVQMTFSIYPDTLGSPADWTETQTEVIVREGIFNVLLGSVVSIPASVFDGSIKYLGVKVESDPEMRPLKQMVSVAYAYRAGTADGSGGGYWSIADSVLYTNDYWGLARGGVSNALYGDSAHTMVNLGVACTTGTSGQNYYHSTVGGGYRNQSTSWYSTVNGGTRNTASGGQATVSGGRINTASGDGATVGGGYADTASGQYATAGGGWDNTASGHYAAVGGGNQNTASGSRATVGGGNENTASGYSATVGGGWNNTASEEVATVGGGNDNTASGTYATVGGGRANTADTRYATVGGGYADTASGYYATVGGGESNSASSYSATVGGGYENTADSNYATVGGGQQNTASHYRATVGGGGWNIASGHCATVGGGYADTVTGEYATAGGGRQNTASGYAATVGGGDNNAASHNYATVGGGYENTASGEYATVPGGYADTVAGDYSFAAGSQVTLTSTADYSFAFGRNFTTSVPNAVIFHNSVVPIRVGIGVTVPTHYIDVAGGAYCNGAQWVSVSSIKYKKDIHSLTPEEYQDILKKLAQTEVVRYRYKSENSAELHIGVIAEDAPEEMVDAERIGIPTGDAVGFLLAALKAQQQEIEALKAMVNELAKE